MLPLHATMFFYVVLVVAMHATEVLVLTLQTSH